MSKVFCKGDTAAETTDFGVFRRSWRYLVTGIADGMVGCFVCHVIQYMRKRYDQESENENRLQKKIHD